MDLLKKVYENIEENKTEMVSSLSALLMVPSVAKEQGGEMPYGEAVHRAFEMVLNLAKDAGFTTWNADNHGGHVEFPKGTEGEAGIVGILGHLDVVPEGSGWEHEPFSGDLIDGEIWGRGAADDKGPVIAALYAMKALKECGYEPKKSIRLILGLDEETNWHGMDYYIENVDRLPSCGFTPDADFPVIRGEKGILTFQIARKFARGTDKGLELSSVSGGAVPNAVPDSASAVLYNTEKNGYEDIKELLSQFRNETGYRINGRGVGKSFKVTASGVSAHGSLPHLGQNAISVLMAFLGRLNFANDDVNDFVGFYNDFIGFNLYGEKIGCPLSDRQSGNLVFNVGIIEMNKQSVQLDINIRYPITCSGDEVYEGIMSVIGRYGFGIIKGREQLPICFEENHPLVATLMEVYREHTGDYEAEPVIIGGGTYARAMDNI
ncbi:MAG: Sapep family Mn(2+)-dependent dipeptidase, partial [Firmicutes bacterium]|nr:Sapep family Mn(2+)-dependent dipeptidase [Bacillota bacterium]